MNAEQATLLQISERFKNVNSEFLHNVTHEFLTPLSIISLNVQILEMLESRKKGSEQDGGNSYLENIKNQVNRLNEVVHDSIDLLKLDTLNENVECSKTDLLELVNTIISSIDLCSHKILFQNKILAESLYITTDQKLVRTCIFRLINHACTTFKTKLPELILRETEEFNCIEVINHEVTLDSNDYDHIFNPFTRTTEMEKIEGMSLALTIIKTRLRLVGADLDVQPAAENGIRYSIRFPKN